MFNDPYSRGFIAAMAAIEAIVAPLRGEFDPENALETPQLIEHLIDDWQRLRVDSLRLAAVERAIAEVPPVLAVA